MENSKRPKVTVKVIDGKCVLVPMKSQNNDCQLRSPSEPVLHAQLLQEIGPLQPPKRPHSSQTEKENLAISSNDSQTSSQPKQPRMQSLPLATKDDEKDSTLLQILTKLNDIQQEQQKINNNFANFVKQMKLMRAEIDMIADRIAPRSGIVRASNFEFAPIGSKAELDKFEQMLNEQEFVKKIQEFLSDRLPADSVEARLHASMDILFKRDFVVQVSWTGIGHPNPKIPFCKYLNILRMYKFIASCHGLEATDSKIKDFFQNKFRHSAQRLNLVGLVKTSHHKHNK